MRFTRINIPIFLYFTIIIMLIGGCSTSSLFVSYPSQLRTIKLQIDNKQFKPAQDTLSEDIDSADKILYLMEKGRTNQIGNDTNTSIQDFALAIQNIQNNEEKAEYTATGAGSNIAAVFSNDNSIPYVQASYERTFLHHFQAMNYLFERNLDAAIVEVRRANESQVSALKKHENEINDEQTASSDNAGFYENFDSLNLSAGRVKNSFQNAYTFYTSGVIYEILDQPNDAYIDYKRALEIFPDNIYLQQDVMRLATSLSMSEDLARFSKKFESQPKTLDKGDGELIVFFEQGFAPPKLELKVNLHTLTGTHSTAFPTYAPLWNNTLALQITESSGHNVLGNTQPIVYVQALASKSLQEKLPGMLARQVIRLVAKNNSRKSAEKQSQGLGALMTIFNFVSENADLRSWLTLPNDAQIFRGALSGGDHTLILNNGTTSGSINVKLAPGKKTIVRVISTGNSIHAESILM